MAANNNNWIADTVGDFIHSPIWAAPIHTFIEANCATFDFDDDATDEDDLGASNPSSEEEQMNIYHQYQRLVDSLIEGLGKDLDLDQNELNAVCQLPTVVDSSVIIDESFEQLYAARDFQLFQEMMRRKNLILQLQALVSLQLQWGLLKQSDTGDDLVLSLLLQATSSPSRRESIDRAQPEPIEQPTQRHRIPEKEDPPRQYEDDDDDDDDDVVHVEQKPTPPPLPSSYKKKEIHPPKKPPKEEYRLPSLRQKGGQEVDAEWYRNLQRQTQEKGYDDNDDQAKKTSTPQTIGAISEEVLREKLRELTVRTNSSVSDETATAMKSRKNFLQEQRDLIVNKQRHERTRDLEKQTHNARPQSAAHVARKAMATTNENKHEDQQQTPIPNDELNKRRAMMAKLKREVVDKR